MSGAGKSEGFDGWALVEVMGHKRFAGRVSEHTVAGQGFIRVDVPALERDGEQFEPFTKLIGPGSIYGITPLSEQVARAMASTLRERPVHTWDLPQPKLAAPVPDDDLDDRGTSYEED